MPMKTRTLTAVLAAAVFLLGALPVLAQSYLDLEDQVREFTLDNGLRFLVLERHDVPTFTFYTYVNVGSYQEVTGVTGIAHILEHMAFKGTSELGTTDYKKELKAMQREDEAFLALRDERARGDLADPDRLAELEAEFEAAVEASKEFVVSNEFGELVEKNGGRGMNAGTGADNTSYFYQMPSNRLELWAYLEGSRMANPVLREFYTEKDGPVTEERRMRTDNNPIGKLIEQFQNAAFMADGYHHSTIGYMSDINNISRQDCQEFYERNYVASNFTIAVVGDVAYDDVHKYAKEYFSDVPEGEPFVPTTTEPEQVGEKRVTIHDTSQPILVLGWKVGSINHPDDAVYDAIADVLGQGRTSRLYTKLVKDTKKAAQAMSFAGYPGKKYPNLILSFAMPSKDVTAAELEELVLAEVERLKTEGVTADELAGVKQRAQANFVRSLRGNRGLARQMCYYQALTGDWRRAFHQAEAIEAITQDDILRVANEIFAPNNLTVASIVTIEDED